VHHCPALYLSLSLFPFPRLFACCVVVSNAPSLSVCRCPLGCGIQPHKTTLRPGSSRSSDGNPHWYRLSGECDGCVSFPRICALTTFCALCSVLCALCSLLCAVCTYALCSVLCYALLPCALLCALLSATIWPGAHTLRPCLYLLGLSICTVQPHIGSVPCSQLSLVCPRSMAMDSLCHAYISCVVDNTALDTKLSMQVLSPFLVSAYLSSLLCVLYVGGVRSANY
jgi:hypothetical protein